MPAPIIPVSGAIKDVPTRAVLKSHEDALGSLRQPGAPVQMPVIDTKADLLAQAPAANWQNCAIICTEINALCISTDVSGTWTWLRADGSAM